MKQQTDLLSVVRRYGIRIVLLAAWLATLTYFASDSREPVYRATAEVTLGEPRTSGVFGSEVRVDPVERLRQEEERITSDAVVQGVVRRLGDGTGADEVEDALSAASDDDGVRVIAQSASAERAAAIANAAVESYREDVASDYSGDLELRLDEVSRYRAGLEAQLDEQTARLEELDAGFRRTVAAAQLDDARAALRMHSDLQGNSPEYTRLEDDYDFTLGSMQRADREIEELTVDGRIIAAQQIDSIEPAGVPGAPAIPQPERDAAVVGMLTLLGATALAWRSVDRHQQASAAAADAPTLLGAPSLGTIPEEDRLRTENPVARVLDPGLPVAEAYQLLAASLRAPLEQHGIRVVLVTSPERGEGRTTTALNLAAATAVTGRRVILVDADLRTRGLSALCGVQRAPGLTEAVEDGAPPADLPQLSVGSEAVVRLVPAGAPVRDVAATLSSPGLRACLQQLAADVDLVVLDAPPVRSRADATLLADAVGGLLVLVSAEASQEELEETRTRLAFLDTPVIGVVRVDIIREEPRDRGRRRSEVRTTPSSVAKVR